MSGIANKVKDSLQTNKTSHPEGTYTTGGVDPAATHSTPRNAAYNPSTTGTGPVGGGNYSVGANDTAYSTTGPAPKTDGPHKSDLMNKADPRVDSDRDYSKNMGMNPHGTADTGRHTTTGQTFSGSHHTTQPTSTSAYGTTGGLAGTTGGTTTSNVPEGTFGPHGSRLANAADPRVDSDLDKTRNLGSTQTTRTAGTTGPIGTTGHTLGGTGHTHGTTTTTSGISEGTFGPHSSRAANAADPRVDSDLDSSRRTAATGTTGASGLGGSTGTTGTHTTGTHTTGTHPTAGTHTTGTHTTGASAISTGPGSLTTGPAPNTAGPHKSDMLNKIDPRVDSNLDGSKTVGGNKTFSSGGDPTR